VQAASHRWREARRTQPIPDSTRSGAGIHAGPAAVD
jgi:hypothetical protein